MQRLNNGAMLNLLCTTGDGLFIVGPDQHIIRWNRGAERILGYPEAEVLGHPCFEVIDGRTHPGKPWCRAQCKVHECALSLTPLENFDLLVRTKDGRRTWTNVSTIRISGPEPVTLHLLRDISTQRRIGEAARRFLADLGASKRSRIDPVPAKSSIKAATARESPSDMPALLSAREIEVLRLLAEGLSTQAVADRLKISRFTARNHTQNIVTKLGLHNKTQAVSWAFRSGLV
jgi:PAS domain S-box-containing protein